MSVTDDPLELRPGAPAQPLHRLALYAGVSDEYFHLLRSDEQPGERGPG